MKILITGATGYLGRHLLKTLVENSVSEVSVFLRPESKTDKMGGLLDQIKQVREITETYDVIIHTATCYGRNGESSEEIYQANVNFPIELIRKASHKETTFFNIDTSLPANINKYAETKSFFLMEAKKLDFKIVNLKLEQFFGPNDGTFFSFILDSLLRKTEYIELTKGEQKRDFIYIEDVVDAIALLLKKQNEITTTKFQEFEIGTGESISLKEFVLEISKMMSPHNTTFKWGARPYRSKEQMNSCANIEKLQNLGWQPRYNLQLAISKSLEELRESEK